MWQALGQVLAAVVGIVGALRVFGWLRVAAHRPRPASGDPSLASVLEGTANRRTRRVAAVTVDLSNSPRHRYAFIDADEQTRFEIGSVTKGLTGLLVADATDRGEVTMATTVGELSSDFVGTSLVSTTLEQLCTHTSGLPTLPRSPPLLVRIFLASLFALDPYRGSAWVASFETPLGSRPATLGVTSTPILVPHSPGTWSQTPPGLPTHSSYRTAFCRHSVCMRPLCADGREMSLRAGPQADAGPSPGTWTAMPLPAVP